MSASSSSPQGLPSDISSEILASATLQAAQSAEKALDAQLNSFDINNDRDLERLRRQRVEEMKMLKIQKEKWKQNGHGEYKELADQKEWFEAAKTSQRLITHFYRPATWRCEILDKHFKTLAAKHIETRFVKIDAEKSPFLCERLSVVVLPAIIMTKENFTHDRLEGFDELGGNDTFSTEILEKRIGKNGMIDMEDEAERQAKSHFGGKKKPVNSAKTSGGAAIYRSVKPPQEIDSEEEFDD